MPFDIDQFSALMAQFMVPFLRIAALFSVAPVLGHRDLPTNVRIALAAPVAIFVGGLLPPVGDLASYDPLSISGFLFIAGQIVIGLAIGFAFRMVFSALEIGGQVISMQMGLGFAEMTDPASGARVPSLGHMYNILGTLVFLGLDGHLMLIQLLVDSFELLPIGQGTIAPIGARQLADWGVKMFQGAVMLALPAIAALLAVNLAAGVMSRAVPQFNMMIAFPMILLLGLIILAVTVPQFFEHFEGMLTDILTTLGTALGEPAAPSLGIDPNG